MNNEFVVPHPGWAEEAKQIAEVAKLMFQQVQTPHGVGLLIGLDVPYNGLYVEPCRAQFTVWYSTDKSQSGWVSHAYYVTDIKPYVEVVEQTIAAQNHS